MSNNTDHSAFLQEWEAATKPIVEKHKKTLVPVFQFGEKLIQAQLIVHEVSDTSETVGSTDPDDQAVEA